jgi:hypothetical protein
MSLKESPIKGNQARQLDLSFLNKDNPLTATPSAIERNQNFSPDTPISQLKNIVLNNENTPNTKKNMNHNFDCESNFAEDFLDDKS